MTRKLSLQSSSIAAFAGVLGLVVTAAFRADAATSAGRISVEYAEPKDPAHRPIYELLKQARALEYLADILKNAPEQTDPAGITRQDAIIGPAVDVFLHESGHAMFDLFKVPIFGREEDAADTFSAYIVLHFPKDDARRLILGSAYQYKADLQDPQVTMAIAKFSNVHGTPVQRFYNVLCIAYGADKKLFADVVEKKYLPEDRADGCEEEYEQAAFAFQKLIDPHIDKARAQEVLSTWIREVDAPPRRKSPK
jgi:hypothetical protein